MRFDPSWLLGFEVTIRAIREAQIRLRDTQKATDAVIAAGVRGILNFAPTQIVAPPEVRVKKVDLTTEFDNLAYHLYAS